MEAHKKSDQMIAMQQRFVKKLGLKAEEVTFGKLFNLYFIQPIISYYVKTLND